MRHVIAVWMNGVHRGGPFWFFWPVIVDDGYWIEVRP